MLDPLQAKDAGPVDRCSPQQGKFNPISAPRIGLALPTGHISMPFTDLPATKQTGAMSGVLRTACERITSGGAHPTGVEIISDVAE